MKARKILGLIIAAASYNSLAVAATTYYVSPVGNDNNSGTWSSPLQTIQAAANRVNPGDTVIVRDGVYTTSKSTAVAYLKRGGTSSSPVTFKSENPGGAKLEGRNNATTYGIIFDANVSYVNIQGFEISKFNQIGVNIGWTHDITLSGNHIHDIGRKCTDTNTGSAGVYVSRSSYITLTNNMLHDIGRYAPGENGCYPSNKYYQNHDHGLYIDGADNIRINSNTFYSLTRGWPIHVYSGSGLMSSYIEINNNTFSYPNPYRDGYIVFAPPGVSQATIKNNIFHQPKTTALSFYKGIYFSGIYVNNNTTYAAVTSNTKPSGVSFYNNIELK